MESRITSNPVFLLSIVFASAIGWFVNVVVRGWNQEGSKNLCRVTEAGPEAVLFIELSLNTSSQCQSIICSFGHLLAIRPYIDKLPSDAHSFITFGQMAREYPGGIFYLDMWPFIGPLVI